MFNIDAWTAEFCEKLDQTFGDRVLFIGLQGSFKRGEATENSDIDIVVILDDLHSEDIRVCGKLVRTMPFADKACGFICGRGVFEKWPRCDVLHLYFDTKPLKGDLSTFVAPFEEREIQEALVFGASALYHGAVHALAFESDLSASASVLRKAAFFTVRVAHYAKTGIWLETKTAALREANETERAFLDPNASPETALNALVEWSGEMLSQFRGRSL